MKNFFTLLLLLLCIGLNYGQSFMNYERIEQRPNNQRDIDGIIQVNNYYIPGDTMNLLFTFDVSTPDQEYVDKVTITFPNGITPITGTNPFPGGHTESAPEALNAIDTLDLQTISWGDNDNSYGGCIPSVYDFFVKVAIGADMEGDQEFTFEISGDEYAGSTHKISGIGIVKQIPSTAELIMLPQGTAAEYYEIPLEQATFTPKAVITNIATQLDTATSISVTISGGYSDTLSLTTPLATGANETLTFADFTAVEEGEHIITIASNYEDDANPESTYTKTMSFGNTLRRDNGEVLGNIGIGTPGGELGNVFQLFAQDTITAVSFELNNNANKGNTISVKIREILDGEPGRELGKSLPFKIGENVTYNISIFPPLPLEAGKYYIGLVEGDNNIQLAVTSTPFVQKTAWAYFGDKWNDLGDIGFTNTYKLRAHFDDVVFVNNDIVIESINNNLLSVEGDIDITGTIRNLSNINSLTEFDISYSIDGGDAILEHISDININPGSTYDFTHNTAYTATAGLHSLQVDISQPNGKTDENLDDNSKSAKLIIVKEVFPKVVLGEEATGTWCGWCVRGHVGLKDMEHGHDDTEWIGIAVHNEDPMTNPEYDAKISAMVGGYPSGIINREAEVDPGDFEQLGFQVRKSEIPVAKVEISRAKMDESTRNITVNCSSTFALDIADADYNLSMIIVEDEVTGSSDGFAQVNYYSQNGIVITDWEGIDWSTLGNPIPAKDMVYNHVGRMIVGGWNGVSNSIPNAVTYNMANEYTFRTELAESFNAENIKVVVIILDNKTGHVVNAVQKHLEIAVGTQTIGDANLIKIYPNPTSGLITVDAIAGSDIVVYDLLGQIVLQTTMKNNQMNINLNGLNNGTYSVEITNDDTVYAKKVVLVK